MPRSLMGRIQTALMIAPMPRVLLQRKTFLIRRGLPVTLCPAGGTSMEIRHVAASAGDSSRVQGVATSQLVNPAPPEGLRSTPSGHTRDLVPQHLLPTGDRIQARSIPSGSDAIWREDPSIITTLIVTSAKGRIEVMTNDSKSGVMELNRFGAITLWPGVKFRILEHDGDIVQLQRNIRNLTQEELERRPVEGVESFSRVQDPNDHTIFDILPPTAQPGFEVKVVEGFVDNNNHYHETFDEAYYCVEGRAVVRLRPHTDKEAHHRQLSAGSCATIPKYTDHKVVGGTPDNRVMVFYWPRFNGENDYHAAG